MLCHMHILGLIAHGLYADLTKISTMLSEMAEDPRFVNMKKHRYASTLQFSALWHSSDPGRVLEYLTQSKRVLP